MKLTNFSLLLILSLFLITGCKDACEDIDCGTNGTCIDGTCECEAGYSGANCERNVCDNIQCLNGNCDPKTGECSCNEGYEGATCETEIRAKYLGTFEGDMNSCIPPFLAGLLSQEDKDNLSMTQIVAEPAATGVLFFDIKIEAELINFSIEVDATMKDFIVDQFSQDIELAGNMVTISGSGTGQLIDTDNIEIMLNIVFEAGGITLDQPCTVLFKRV